MSAIDRGALLTILMEQWTAGPRETADRILALVRPVEDRWAEGFAKGYHAAAAIFQGPDPRLVTLTEAETLLVIRALVDWHGGSDGEFHARRNLAARLEAVAA